MPVGNDIVNLIRFIRLDIGDDGSTPTFTDLQIVSTIAKASIRLDSKIGNMTSASGGFVQFEQAMSGNDQLASGMFVRPSGAGVTGLPNELFNLVMLQAECILAKRKYFDAVLKGIRVKDGDTEIDTTAGFKGYDSLVTGGGGPCAELDKALEDLNARVSDDITAYAQIIWKGNMSKAAFHTHGTSPGGREIERLPDHSDWFRSYDAHDDQFTDAGGNIPT